MKSNQISSGKLFLERFARDKLHGFGSGDFDGLLGFGIDPVASLALGHFEGSEADELHGTVIHHTFFDTVDHGVHGVFSLGFAKVITHLGFHGVYQFSFIHSQYFWCSKGMINVAGRVFQLPDWLPVFVGKLCEYQLKALGRQRISCG
jgi:hypothetical protein